MHVHGLRERPREHLALLDGARRVDDHTGAIAGEPLRDRPADTARRPRDYDDLAHAGRSYCRAVKATRGLETPRSDVTPGRGSYRVIGATGVPIRSPDGSRIAIARIGSTSVGARAGVFVMDADGRSAAAHVRDWGEPSTGDRTHPGSPCVRPGQVRAVGRAIAPVRERCCHRVRSACLSALGTGIALKLVGAKATVSTGFHSPAWDT